MRNTRLLSAIACLPLFLAMELPAVGRGDEGEDQKTATSDTALAKKAAPDAAKELAIVAEEETRAAEAEEGGVEVPNPEPEAEPAVKEPAREAGWDAAEEPPAPVAEETTVASPDAEPVAEPASDAASTVDEPAGSTMPEPVADEDAPGVLDPVDRADLTAMSSRAVHLQEEQKRLADRVEIVRLKNVIQSNVAADAREKAVMHYNLAGAYKAAGDLRNAEAELLQAAKLDPFDAATQYNLGILYDDDLKDKKKAREHYERYLLLDPESRDRGTVLEWLRSL